MNLVRPGEKNLSDRCVLNQQIAFLIGIVVLASSSALLSGCLGYVPGRQSHWDARVRELCDKDAGVFVYERVTLSQSEYQRLRGPGGAVVVPIRTSAPPDAPFVREHEERSIRRGNPQVLQLETRIIRTADNKLLSRWITYMRIGGDIPSPAHASSFSCRDAGFQSDIEQQTFVTPATDK
jgi:hypothetical protein